MPEAGSEPFVIFERGLRIFKNRDALLPTWTPHRILFRDDEIAQISINLGYSLIGSTPSHMLILGLPGTGKTATVLFVINKLKEKIREENIEDVLISYTISGRTSYSTLVELASDIDIYLPMRGYSFKEAWKKFKEEIGDKIFIAVIDEIDLLILNGGRDLLYYLSRTPKISIIGISNILNVLDLIKDPRVRSSFSPQILVFNKYNAEQLRGILEDRVKEAFYSGVVEEGAIALSSALSAQRGGDARFALDLMLKAGEKAVIEGKDKIDESLIYDVVDDVETLHVKRAIEKLPLTHRYLLSIIAANQGLSPSEIYEIYNRNAPSPLTRRRLSSFLSELELFGIIRMERKGRGRGRGIEYSVFLTEPQLRRMLEDISLS